MEKTNETNTVTTEVLDSTTGTGLSNPTQIQLINGVLSFFASNNGTSI